MILACVAALAALACQGREPTALEAGALNTAVTPALATAAGEAGCATFEVRLSGRDSISVTDVTQEDCGPVRPVVMNSSRFERAQGRVWLAIALENRGQQRLRAPASLFGWEDSLAVVAPPGLADGQHAASYLDLAAPDSVIPASSEVMPGARLWRFDEQLAPEGETQELNTGTTSGTRLLEIKVHQGVAGFRVAFAASAQRAGQPIPAFPPDSTPDHYSDVLVSGAPCVPGGQIVHGLVILAFERGTTYEQRQQVVDLVGGEVVGGIPISEYAFYVLRVDDEGDGRGVCAAVERLNELPSVRVATPDAVADSNYREPADGVGWIQWEIRPDFADDENWALEAIAAPLAWGCETGNRDAAVAVVDQGFRLANNEELARNVDRQKSMRLDVSSRGEHGTEVASVLAAGGDDGEGMTGVMWTAALRLLGADSGTQPVQPLRRILLAVETAILEGARVVNLSAGVPWNTVQPDPANPMHRALAEQWAAALRVTLEDLAAAPWEKRLPLLVLSAGNSGTDAYMNGFPQVQAHYPDLVISVGSMTLEWTRASDSNVGDLVEIAAPGAGVYTRKGDGRIDSAFGTSYAAPLVTGIAGLLLSFDPSIRNDEIKGFLLEGARRGGRTVDGKPVANAYESLKAAAERPGAPLCGNRVWSQDGKIVAQRGTETEVLFDLGQPARFLNAHHGGRRVDVFRGSWSAFLYEDGRWSAAGDYWSLPAGFGATYASASGYSHSADSAVVVEDYGGSGSRRHEFWIKDWKTGMRSLLHSFSVAEPGSSQAYCLLDIPDEGCPDWGATSIGSSVTSSSRAGYSPAGDQAFISLTRMATRVMGLTGWRTCASAGGPPPSGYLCRGVLVEQVSQGSTIYSLDLRGGQPATLLELPGKSVFWLAAAEAGAELVSGEGVERRSWMVEPFFDMFPGGNMYFRTVSTTGDAAITNCTLEYRPLRASTADPASIPTPDQCAELGGGTISARRVAVGDGPTRDHPPHPHH